VGWARCGARGRRGRGCAARQAGPRRRLSVAVGGRGRAGRQLGTLLATLGWGLGSADGEVVQASLEALAALARFHAASAAAGGPGVPPVDGAPPVHSCIVLKHLCAHGRCCTSTREARCIFLQRVTSGSCEELAARMPQPSPRDGVTP
jgi:hypothetical protein